jgi:hypothetical protein
VPIAWALVEHENRFHLMLRETGPEPLMETLSESIQNRKVAPVEAELLESQADLRGHSGIGLMILNGRVARVYLDNWETQAIESIGNGDSGALAVKCWKQPYHQLRMAWLIVNTTSIWRRPSFRVGDKHATVLLSTVEE